MYQAPKLERFGTLRELTATPFSALGTPLSLASGSAVSAYAAEVRRDLTTLDRVAATFIAWHRSPQDPRAMATAS